ISKTFKHAISGQGFLFIQDLARVGMKGPSGLHWDSIVMLLLFGGTTYVTQKMMTTNPDDPTQKQMLVTMPLMITVMFAWFPVPAGVLLYIVASNFITLAQNYFLMQWSPALHTPAGFMEPATEEKKEEETKKEEPGKEEKKNPHTRKKGK
ncbi:MAG TPA: YidC/Oxa1 family membrane protein insertase, partial [Chroococcales cyanobacterium]